MLDGSFFIFQKMNREAPLFFVDSNCRPWQFHGQFSALWAFWSSNCRPWQFHGHFSAICPIHDEIDVLKLPTLAVSWPLFSTPVALALKLPTLAVLWPFSSNCRPW